MDNIEKKQSILKTNKRKREKIDKQTELKYKKRKEREIKERGLTLRNL